MSSGCAAIFLSTDFPKTILLILLCTGPEFKEGCQLPKAKTWALLDSFSFDLATSFMRTDETVIYCTFPSYEMMEK